MRWTPTRGERVGHAVFLFLLYFFVPFARGHGIGTVGLMMFFPEFPLPRITGWIGTGLLALALLPGNRHLYRFVTLGGIVLCFGSILLTSAESDPALLTLIFSIPFAGYALLWLEKTGWRVRRAS